jgi:hypothetical protein
MKEREVNDKSLKFNIFIPLLHFRRNRIKKERQKREQRKRSKRRKREKTRKRRKKEK